LGVTTVVLPNRWANEKGFGEAIKDIVVVGANKWQRDDDNKLTVHSRPTSQIEVSYSVTSLVSELANASGELPSKPVLSREGFYSIGAMILMQPILQEPTPVQIKFTGLPTGWTALTDLGGDNYSLEEVKASVILAGPIVEKRHKSPLGTPVTFAYLNGTDRGFTEEFKNKLEITFDATEQWWAKSRKNVLVALVKIPSQSVGRQVIGGQGLGADGIIFFSNTLADETVVLDRVIHEYQHLWAPALGSFTPYAPRGASHGTMRASLTMWQLK
jgi:predicted metalloprotease with PDZ domain